MSPPYHHLCGTNDSEYTNIICASFGLRNTKECSMTYRQSETYNRAKYLKNVPLQSVSSRRNLQVVDRRLKMVVVDWKKAGDSFWMKQTVAVSF